MRSFRFECYHSPSGWRLSCQRPITYHKHSCNRQSRHRRDTASKGLWDLQTHNDFTQAPWNAVAVLLSACMGMQRIIWILWCWTPLLASVTPYRLQTCGFSCDWLFGSYCITLCLYTFAPIGISWYVRREGRRSTAEYCCFQCSHRPMGVYSECLEMHSLRLSFTRCLSSHRCS
jgi:hypothetical protein